MNIYLFEISMLEINLWICREDDIYFFVKGKALIYSTTKFQKRNISSLPDVTEDYAAFWAFAHCS